MSKIGVKVSLGLMAIAALAFNRSSAQAEVNQAVEVQDVTFSSPVCKNYKLTQLASYISCRNYHVIATVKVHNITPQRTGKNLRVSIRTNKNTICGSAMIHEDIFAGGYVEVPVSCTTLGKRDSSAVPSTLEAIVHQDGNISNGTSAGPKNAPWCGSWEPDSFSGACGSF